MPSRGPATLASGVGRGRTVHSAAIGDFDDIGDIGEILVVCTGNTCRSPMAEALLRAELERLGVVARVHSAGTLAWRGGASEGARAAMAERGIDVSAHTSRALQPEMVAGADLVIGMTRVHVWSAITHAPDAADRAFLVGELARLGELAGPRRPDEPLAEWAARVATRRADPRVPGLPHEEVPDPAGEPVEVYRATAARLAGDLARVARLIGGSPGGG
jgi:protein-tyrosine phosphatase